jgi:hypothetical protein
MGFLRTLLALFALTVALSSLAADPAPSGFRALTWGSRVPAGLKRLTGPTSDGTSLYVPGPGRKPDPLLGAPVAEEAYSFTHGKFYSASAWFDGAGTFDRLKTTLISKYGQPTFSNPSINLYKWKWPRMQVEIHLYYQARFSRTTLTFINNAI